MLVDGGGETCLWIVTLHLFVFVFLYVMGDDVVIVTFGFNDVQCWLILSCS